jgi:uncharacterized protein DUF6982
MARRMVIRLTDGSLAKGFSHDFVPGKDVFHLQTVHADGGLGELQAIRLEEVHAIFYVRDFAFGRTKRYTPENAPWEPPAPPTAGARRLKVTCVWGEVLEGLCYGYDDDRPGFFLFVIEPVERTFNLERAFFTRQAVSGIDLSAA